MSELKRILEAWEKADKPAQSEPVTFRGGTLAEQGEAAHREAEGKTTAGYRREWFKGSDSENTARFDDVEAMKQALAHAMRVSHAFFAQQEAERAATTATEAFAEKEDKVGRFYVRPNDMPGEEFKALIAELLGAAKGYGLSDDVLTSPHWYKFVSAAAHCRKAIQYADRARHTEYGLQARMHMDALKAEQVRRDGERDRVMFAPENATGLKALRDKQERHKRKAKRR